MKSLPIIHPGGTVQIIDDKTTPPMWKTVGKCLDTPKAIRKVMAVNGLQTTWFMDCLGDRRYVKL